MFPPLPINFFITTFFTLYVSFFSNFSLAVEQVVTSHPLATKVGEQILKDGGNAYDAAVGISAALSVVEPFASGLGGGGFWLMHNKKTNKYIFVDARETAPEKVSLDMFLDRNGNHIKKASRDGPLAAGIPGTPAALCFISENYGSIPLANLLQPAIKYAEHGFQVDERYIKGAKYKSKLLLKYPASSAIFLDQEKVPELGWVLYQKDLAQTLRNIGKLGFKGFYSGGIAEKLVSAVNKDGGVWTEKDLTKYKIINREPIIFSYKNNKIITPNLPSAGGLMLQYILNNMAKYEKIKLSTLEMKHLIIELLKRAYFLRNLTMGDPDFSKKEFNINQRIDFLTNNMPKIKLNISSELNSFPKHQPTTGGEGRDTTHFAVVDKFGNKVAVTQSINFWFGSGFVAKNTGVLLNNEMDDFLFNQADNNKIIPNSIQPNKRMLSSMTPMIIESERGYAVLGTPGGKRIVSMVLLAALDWMNGGDAKSMLSIPRYHHQFFPNYVLYEESALSLSEIETLEAMGHKLKKSKRLYGNMQIITWDEKTKKIEKASDPRAQPKNKSRIY